MLKTIEYATRNTLTALKIDVFPLLLQIVLKQRF